MKSESIKELASALAKVKFGEIGKSKSVKVQTKTGGSYSFQYAPMEEIMSAIRGPLAKEGLSLVQSVDGTLAKVVETTLLHASGEWISSYSPVILPQKFDNQGKPIDTTAQEMGSAITYARRYGVTLACCLVADEDDDANIADGNKVETVKSKEDSPGKIVDQTLSMEGLPPEVQKAIREEAIKIGVDFHQVGAKAALGSWNAFKATAGEQEIEACWQHIDSKVRSGIKKYGQAMELGTQA